MTFYLRTAAPSDLPAVQQLLAETWHATYDRLYGVEKVTELTARWHSQETLRKRLTLPHSEFVLADDGSNILGMAFARMEKKDVRLHQLYVSPRHQKRGIGRALLAEVMDCFPEAETISLEVDENNVQALTFYQRNGFSECGRTSDCGGNGDELPALILSRSLRPDS
ncbi:GNAT family N-acetyltransferase [Nitratireductor basaltis]|uniref:GCN5-like N-acetyltransferase n=1 Tax=Nitratireductor basaltis TaxID=472175 RepID=A0A084UAQ7_9HYPH|nr:GNAT family N-acetyltransferase [Nitratireductor basaltis]KFB10043.1 GCN5-like N-acetyltransferase [Nitratireductor basaltis]